ncbi:MAG: hypothetical protein P8L85_23520, partial [Rubripirellula sp.]|nr:hypothetical protein [Rubripirellula sp.]
MNLRKLAAGSNSLGWSLPNLQIQLSAATIHVPHVAVVCSRLGHQRKLHQHVGRQLVESAMRCKSQGERWIVANGSAIEPWAHRAAELFGVPITTLGINEPADIVICAKTPPSRDAAIIAIADRIEAAYVRRRGTIEHSLKERLKSDTSASTQVAITPFAPCAAKELIRCGAIGRYSYTLAAPNTPSTPTVSTNCPRVANEAWTQTEGRWLIHCTRGQPANWPDETIRQYRDAILLGESDTEPRGPLEALTRILRSGRLIASARTSRRTYPVVCFSALSLQELLARRCFRSHVSRWDYEPFGIAIRLQAAKRIGVQPVIYGEPSERKQLAEADRFRFHPHGKTHDWRSEQEWRSPKTIDLNQLNAQDVRIFAAVAPAQGKQSLSNMPWRVTFAVAAPRPDSPSGT